MQGDVLDDETRLPRGSNLVCTLSLTREEARRGCTRHIAVAGREETITVPPGSKDGQTIWLARKGEPSPAGGRPGDLSVRLDVAALPPGTFEFEELENQQLELRNAPLPDPGGTGNVSPEALLEVVERMARLPVPAEGAEVAPVEEKALSTPKPAAKRGGAAAFAVMAIAAVAALVFFLVTRNHPATGPGTPGATPPVATTSQPPVVPASVSVRVCPDSGKLASAFCPHPESREFPSGQEPKESCTQHKPVSVRVCATSGLLPTSACPSTHVIQIAPGKAPQSKCTVHHPAAQVSVRICTASGLRATAHCPPNKTVMRSYAPGKEPKGYCSVHSKTAATAASPAPSRAAVRYCGVCGAPLAPGTRFCGRCGHKL